MLWRVAKVFLPSPAKQPKGPKARSWLTTGPQATPREWQSGQIAGGAGRGRSAEDQKGRTFGHLRPFFTPCLQEVLLQTAICRRAAPRLSHTLHLVNAAPGVGVGCAHVQGAPAEAV